MTRLSGGWSWSRGASCSALAQLLCLALVAHSAWAQNASAPTNATASTGGEKYDLIVVLKDLKTLLTLKAMCTPNQLLFRLYSNRTKLPADCHMPGICKRVYSTALFGFSGTFSDAEFLQLQRCLPQAVWYRELDGTVTKAEDVALRQWATGNEHEEHGRRLTQAQVGTAAAAMAVGNPVPGSMVNVPMMEAFDDVGTAPAGEGPPIDLGKITGGVDFGAAVQKRQAVTPVLWNLDRIDQRNLPLDGQYTYGSPTSSGTGSGVTIYVIDSGIKATHQEFRKADGSGSRASYGYDFVNDNSSAEDCDGHGTHVAGTAAGIQVGVAKDANIVAVRILDCQGSGTISNTVAALDWVAANAQKPAVATLSLGIQVGSWSRVLEDAVRSLVVNHGITVVVASGNSGVDACYVAPADVPEVITVGATDVDTKYSGTNQGDKETMYRWSNTGPCLDIFGPGVDIYSACGGQSRCDTVDDTSYTYASGTSMAVPAVAGVAALYLQANPKAPPQTVAAAIISAATQGLIDASGFKPGTVNRLLTSKLEFGNSSTTPGAVLAANGP